MLTFSLFFVHMLSAVSCMGKPGAAEGAGRLIEGRDCLEVGNRLFGTPTGQKRKNHLCFGILVWRQISDSGVAVHGPHVQW